MAPLRRALDPLLRGVVALALKEVGGLEVIACADAPQALAVAPSARPQLLLADLGLPGMDGVAAWMALRRTEGAEGLPAVFFTGDLEERSAQRCMDAGAWGVITKPFDPVTLAQRLAQLWQSRQSTR